MAMPDRWPPWIEPIIRMTAPRITVNSTVNQSLPGMTVTLTPHVATRISIELTVLVIVTTPSSTAGPGEGFLIVEITIDGVALAWSVNARPKDAGGREMYSQNFTVDLEKETTYTIAARARLNNTTGTPSYDVVETHTGMLITGMPKLHT
jgi:hypothetical protein